MLHVVIAVYSVLYFSVLLGQSSASSLFVSLRCMRLWVCVIGVGLPFQAVDCGYYLNPL